MNAHAHAMASIVAKRDANVLLDVNQEYQGWEAMLEADRLYDLSFEADENTTPEAYKEVEAWLCGEIERLPRNGWEK